MSQPVDRVVKVTVLPGPYIKGWDGGDLEGVEGYPVVSIEKAFADRYDTDAHFVPYYIDGAEEIPRINKGALEHVNDQLKIAIGVLDIDDPVAHRDRVPALAAWRDGLKAKLADLPDLGWYMTRGGARVFWLLPEPMKVEQWALYMQAARNWFKTEHGIESDTIKAWGQLYRLPRVFRDGKNLKFEDSLIYNVFNGPWKVEEVAPSFAGIEHATGAFALPDEIIENRNNTLTSFAGKLRRAGLDKATIGVMLGAVNAQRCKPPLEQDEIDRIATSIAGYEPGPAMLVAGPEPDRPVFDHDSHVVLGEHIADGLGESVVFDLGKFWRYCSAFGVWTDVEGTEVKQQIHRLDRCLIYKGLDRRGQPRYVPLKVTDSLVKGVFEVSAQARTRNGFFDQGVEGMTFQNGFVRVDETGVKIEPSSPDQRSTCRIDQDFPAEGEPLLFLQTLREIFKPDFDCDDKIRMICEMIGACLVGQASTYQKGMILVGDGANGKSLLIDVIASLFPGKTITAIRPQALGGRDSSAAYYIAQLAGSRINLLNELPASKIWDGAAIKSAITGDPLVGRPICQSPFTFRPKAGWILAGNELPAVEDISPGFYRRWMIVEFNRVFRETEQDRKRLKKILKNEIGFIIRFCLEKYVDLYRRGHHKPAKSSEKALKFWKLQNDSVAFFLKSRTEAGDLQSKFVSATDLFKKYSGWARVARQPELSSTAFGIRVKKLGVPSKRTEQSVVYALQLITTH